MHSNINALINQQHICRTNPGSGKLLNLRNVLVRQQITEYDNAGIQMNNFLFQRTDVEHCMMASKLASEMSLHLVILQQQKEK